MHEGGFLPRTSDLNLKLRHSPQSPNFHILNLLCFLYLLYLRTILPLLCLHYLLNLLCLRSILCLLRLPPLC